VNDSSIIEAGLLLMVVAGDLRARAGAYDVYRRRTARLVSVVS
jgi:hypothetical protein